MTCKDCPHRDYWLDWGIDYCKFTLKSITNDSECHCEKERLQYESIHISRTNVDDK